MNRPHRADLNGGDSLFFFLGVGRLLLKKGKSVHRVASQQLGR
jgi:hypothetical protein